jgi:hypothetical protein
MRFRSLFLIAATVLGMTCGTIAMAQEKPSAAKALTEQEQKDGWKYLFDGTSFDNWRNYKQDKVSDGWKIVDGAISRVGQAGDLITKEKYGAFELKLEFKIAPAGNSGVMYRVLETDDASYFTGPEIQIQDNKEGHDPQKCGWLYQLYSSDKDATKPAGQWNELHVIISPKKCEHYVNGVKYCEYEIGSDDWNKKVAASKFASFKEFGKASSGHICLQDHNDAVSYRNIKIRVLDDQAK